MALSYKKLRMITTCPIHTGGHFRVCAIQKISGLTRQISGLNNNIAQRMELLQYWRKIFYIECRCCSNPTLTLSSVDRNFMQPHVEGCYGKLCLYPDFLLHAIGFSLWCMNLDTYVSGEYTRGLVATGAVAYIRLFWPPGTLGLNILACLGHMANFGDSWQGCYTW